eukprot:1157694-Pelagomonas_calceolata.AAC.8
MAESPWGTRVDQSITSHSVINWGAIILIAKTTHMTMAKYQGTSQRKQSILRIRSSKLMQNPALRKQGQWTATSKDKDDEFLLIYVPRDVSAGGQVSWVVKTLIYGTGGWAWWILKPRIAQESRGPGLSRQSSGHLASISKSARGENAKKVSCT